MKRTQGSRPRGGEGTACGVEGRVFHVGEEGIYARVASRLHQAWQSSQSSTPWARRLRIDRLIGVDGARREEQPRWSLHEPS
jgi:hypothetical protein